VTKAMVDAAMTTVALVDEAGGDRKALYGPVTELGIVVGREGGSQEEGGFTTGEGGGLQEKREGTAIGVRMAACEAPLQPHENDQRPPFGLGLQTAPPNSISPPGAPP
jgi:hypothetical protein